MIIQHLGHGRIFHERYEYIRTPTEPQKISGASTIPATIILVTAKTPQTRPGAKSMTAVEALVSA
ncbi:hypothetical protein ELI24_11440 [Rhizobium ruizarguesonis]|jgi:hypothetical protein|uniref:Uncharacterized protein n=1 Tax=Rhizobium ruizarguesonis TaxID=2081791 RepID=A0AAE8U266_9HYPH|nr:hypothetical protein [Rhizobium leguminosarum bv. viciae]NKQ87675.1 hypothetical protein [Rhizobium ruizarguesonis]NKL27499.1 hypothetical protein [Rhizobium leguminosarum bv. viciae]NKL44516.1 hypothetical protein [Rhizobium leguminosarum bv. viciae]TAT78598.1 hypothetical protein ELI56_10575 [Rhizobium ruizarguesonis]